MKSIAAMVLVPMVFLALGAFFVACEDENGGEPSNTLTGQGRSTDTQDTSTQQDTGSDSSEAQDTGSQSEEPQASDDVILGEGYIIDDATGLEWENPPGNKGMGGLGPNFASAKTYCEHLYLDGGQGWRLPTIDELRTILRNVSATMAGGICPTSESCTNQNQCNDDDKGTLGFDDACDGCNDETRAHLTEADCPYLAEGECYWMTGLEGTCAAYWSSTLNTSQAAIAMGGAAYYLRFSSGHIGSIFKTENEWVRCVRPLSERP